MTRTFFLCMLLLNCSYAIACSCSTLSIGQRVVQADIVTVGEVLDSRQICLETIGGICYGPIIFYVQNSDVLKNDFVFGNKPRQLGKSIFMSFAGNCSFYPQKGQNLLLFGTLVNDTSNMYTTNVCSGNQVLEDSVQSQRISEIRTFLDVYKDDSELKKHESMGK